MPTQRIPVEALADANLIVDAIYEGGRAGNAGDDPLVPLIGVSNQGGFRLLGTKQTPNLIVMYSTLNDADWPDKLDPATGRFTYFGDNRDPGQTLHATKRWGNELLRDMFAAIHSTPAQRDTVPPVLLFAKAGNFRDMTFLGLAVPGAEELSPVDDLVAIWKSKGNERFQNYRATLTVLDVPELSRQWLDDIKDGNSLSASCPNAWRQWVETGAYRPLKAEPSIEYRTKAEQIPTDAKSLEMIQIIHDYFTNQTSYFAFEHCATKIATMMDPNFVRFEVTPPRKDGGRDAIGKYRIGNGPSEILVDFSLEAKCWDPLKKGCGVSEMGRVISRLRHRQFGVLVTTAYLGLQPYKELKKDGHPVVIIAATDIINTLAQSGITRSDELRNWLVTNFPT